MLNTKSAWLIYNSALNTVKFEALHDWYRKTAKNRNIDLKLISNIEIVSLVDNSASKLKCDFKIEKPDFVIFLDKDLVLARQLEMLGYKLYNSSSSIEICDNKIYTHQILADKGINVPKTIYSPLVFTGTHEDNTYFIDRLEEELNYPMVVKEAYGSFGEQVYLVHCRDELIKKRRELLYKPHIYQEYIESSYGRDVRLYVVGSKVLVSTLRVSERDFRANASAGGKMHVYEPSDDFKEVAIRASKIVGADFSGVDILFGDNGEPILCEVNTNAHIINVFHATGVDVSEYIFDYIVEDLKNA